MSINKELLETFKSVHPEVEFWSTFDPLEYLWHRLDKGDANAYVEPSPEIEALQASIKQLYEDRDAKCVTTEELAKSLIDCLIWTLKQPSKAPMLCGRGTRL